MPNVLNQHNLPTLSTAGLKLTNPRPDIICSRENSGPNPDSCPLTLFSP